nr:hypothetical protein [Tanacetum cinerariifolium]
MPFGLPGGTLRKLGLWAWVIPSHLGPGPIKINNKYNGPRLSPGPRWHDPDLPRRTQIGLGRFRRPSAERLASAEGNSPEKVHQEKVQQEQLKAVKARLKFKETSRHFESGILSRSMGLKKRLGPRHARIMFRSPEPRRGRSKSPRERGLERKTVFKRLEKGVFHRLKDKEKSVSAYLRDSRHQLYNNNNNNRRDTKSCYQSSRSRETEFASEKYHNEITSSRRIQALSESEDEKWRPLTMNGRNHFHHGNSKKPDRSRTSGREAFGTNKGWNESNTDSLSSKNTKRDPGFRQRKVQASSANDNPERKKALANSANFMRKYDIPLMSACTKRGKLRKMLKAGKLSRLIKTLKQSNGKDQVKAAKKEETLGKDKLMVILMVQPWQRVARQKVTQTFSPESVISFPPLGEEDGTEGPMIIETEMEGHCVHRMYIDGGSSLEILYEHCFNRFRPKVRTQMILATTPLVGCSGEIIWPLGQISLLVKIGDVEHSNSAWMNFMVVRSPYPYNEIIKRPGPVINQVTEEKIHVAIHLEYLEQIIAIGSMLTEEGRKELCGLLRRNLDIFSWNSAKMIGVPRHIAEHRLNIHEGCLPVIQKKRGQAPERNKAIYEEVENLLEDVRRFQDLNKACPKDGYLLSKIDWNVESLCGYPFKCFLDAYKGYHQIKMAKKDVEKTTFITSQRIFCYSKVPFRLKNAEATYQRLVDKAFQKQMAETWKEGKFLGYKVDADGLRVYSDKVKAVLNLPSPKCLKDVQKLNGKQASLNKFMSKSAEKSLPFFKTLKKCTKKSDFQWTAEAEMTFKQMNSQITHVNCTKRKKGADHVSGSCKGSH